MGTLYSCILKAISTVYGPDGPDTGGPTDPDDCDHTIDGACCPNGLGNGCDPDPPDDCEEMITVYYCTYHGAEGNCSVKTDTFTKEELVGVVTGVNVCSDPVPPSFVIGDTTYYTDAGAIISCCIDVDYNYCVNAHLNECGTVHGGCNDTATVTLNIADIDDANDQWPVAGTTGWSNKQLCLANSTPANCCITPPPPPPPFDDQGGATFTTFGGGGDLDCRCKLQSPPTDVVTLPLTPAGFRKVATFTQECDKAEPGDESDNGEILSDWGDSAGNPTMICTSEGYTGVLWKDCKTGGSCGGSLFCSDLVYTIKCVPGICETITALTVGAALSDAYSYMSEPFNNTAEGWLVCPDDDLIVFAPGRGSLASWLGDDNINTTLKIAGRLSPQINQDTGHITISGDALAGATGTQILTVILTTECASELITSELLIFFDPEDMVICSDYASCEGLTRNCGFTAGGGGGSTSVSFGGSSAAKSITDIFDGGGGGPGGGTSTDFEGPAGAGSIFDGGGGEPKAVATMNINAIIPTSPISNEVETEFSQFIGQPLLDSEGLPGSAYLTPGAFASEAQAWTACNGSFGGDAFLFIDPLDSEGKSVTVDPDSFSLETGAAPGNLFYWTTMGITIDTVNAIPNRIMLNLGDMNGNAIDTVVAGDYFMRIKFTDPIEGNKTLDLYCQQVPGGAAPSYPSYPKYIDCAGGLPGLGFGKKFLNALSFRNTLRKFRASYSTRQSVRGSAQKDYLDGLSRRRSSEVLFDPVTSNETYAPKRQLFFIPYKTRTMYYRNIFSKIIDYRIHLIREYYNSPNDATDYSESIFQDLTLQNIHQSLTKEFRVKVNNLKNPDGTPLKNTILGKIRYLIIKDQLGSFNISDINNMGTLTKEVDPGLVTGPSFTALKEIIATVNKSKSLNPLEYRGVGAQRIRRWKTIASDLSKNLPIIEEDLSVEQLFVHDTDLIDFALSDGTSTSVPITDFDEINFIKADGTQSTLNLDTQIHRSKVMDFEDLTNSFKKINDTFNIKLTASSAAVAKIEEDASLSSNRSSEYVFKLDPSSLTDLDRGNPLVRLTSCNYDLITDPVEIEDWTKNKVYPFYSFYINHTDLFLDHMEKKEQLTAEYKDISFDSFASSESEEYAVIPRRIPWYIVVIPTDRNDLLTSIGASKLVDYQTRVISFKLSSKTSDYKQNYSSPIMDETQSDYFLNTATGREYFDYFTYKYNDSKVKDTIKPFKKGYEILPRPEPSTRALFKAIRGVVADGNEFVERNSNTITWGSVYQRMSKQDKKSVSLVDSFNFSDLKSKFLLGKISSNDTINAEFGKVKDSVNSGIKNVSKYVPTPAKKMTIEKLVEDSVEEFPGG